MAIVYNISAVETPTFRPRPRGGEASPAGPDAPAFRPRPRGGQAGSPSPATTPEKRGNLLGRRIGNLFHRDPHTRESASPPASRRAEPAPAPQPGPRGLSTPLEDEYYGDLSGLPAASAPIPNSAEPATPDRKKNPLEKLGELRDRVNQAQIPFLPHRNPQTREPASPLDGVRLDRSTRAILDSSRQGQHTGLPAEPAPAAPEPALTPEKRSRYKRLGSIFWGMAVNWGKNLDFRGKDKAWLIGMGMGAGIGVASNFWVAPGMDRLIVSGTKFAASQSVYAVTKGAYALEKSRLNKQVTGEDLSRRLEEIERRRSRAMKLIGNFMLGMSAGTTYTSITGIGLGTAEHFLKTSLFPYVDTKAIAEKVINKAKDKMPEVGMPDVKLEMPDVGAEFRGVTDKIGGKIQEVVTGGEPPVAPDAAAGFGETFVPTRESLETLTQTKEYQDSIAAAVGNHLDLTDQAVNEAIKGMGVDPAKVSQQTFEHARQLVQHKMEEDANHYFNPANYPDFDFSGRPMPLAELKEAFTQNFDNYTSTPGRMGALQFFASSDLRESFVSEMVSSDPFKQSVAAAVGAHLDTVTNNTVNEVLAARGLDPNKLSPEALQKMHDALRHQMENYANFRFDSAAETAVGRGILDTQAVAAEGNKLFANFLNLPQAHDQLVKTATEALGQPTQIPSFDLSSLSPADLTEQIIPNNTTVGHMLFEAGMQTGWGADNAELFAAEIAANYDLLGSPIPLSELKSLVAAAQNGDVEALKKLHAALRLIPAGSKFNILSKAGVAEVLARLPG